MSKILVTGASGLFGCTLVPVLREQGHEVVGASRGVGEYTADLRDPRDADALLQAVQPDTVINLVSATNVDECEKDPQHAYQMNVRTVENLVDGMRWLAAPPRLLHLSTDHVYDGTGPQAENQVVIRNHYAMSKLAGEQVALRAPGPVTVLRINFVGRSQCDGRQSFSDWVHAALKNGMSVKVFTDVWFSPLRMTTLSQLLGRLASRPVSTDETGVFNLGASSAMSKAQLARQLAALTGFDARNISDAAVADSVQLAPRPRGMAMNSRRFQEVFDIELPSLESEVAALAEEYEK